MKKLFLLLLSCSLIGLLHPVHAQTEKGNLMIGTQVANLGGTFQSGSNIFNLELTPSAAYFIKNNIALGGMLDFGLRTQKNAPTTFTYGIGPWARFYFPVPEEMKFSAHTAFFVDAFVGLQGVSHSKGGGSTNGLGIKIGPGLSYFISHNVSLDASLDYNLVLGFGNATTINKLGINVGFQIFLPSQELKEKYNQHDF